MERAMNITPYTIEEKNALSLSCGLIHFGVFGYIAVLLFNGVLMHVGLGFPILESIRPILPELMLLFSILGWLFNNKKVTYKTLGFGVFFLIVMGLSVSNFSIGSLLITLRNFIIPFIFMLLISFTYGTHKQFGTFFKWLYYLFGFFAFLGSVFAIFQQVKGWEWMSTYFQGYASWGNDGDVRVVFSSYNTLRVLGTTGDSTTFGLYNTLAILIFVFGKNKAKIIRIILTFLSVVSIFNSGNKTALLLSVFIIGYFLMCKLFGKNSKKRDRFVLIFTTIMLIILLLFAFDSTSKSVFYSVNLRLSIWASIFTWNNVSNLIIPHSLFAFSSMGGSGGVTTIWDNSYLFLLFSFGIVGFILLFLTFYKLFKSMWKCMFVKVMALLLLLSMMSTNIFVGRNIAGFSMLLIGVLYANRWSLTYEK